MIAWIILFFCMGYILNSLVDTFARAPVGNIYSLLLQFVHSVRASRGGGEGGKPMKISSSINVL